MNKAKILYSKRFYSKRLHSNTIRDSVAIPLCLMITAYIACLVFLIATLVIFPSKAFAADEANSLYEAPNAEIENEIYDSEDGMTSVTVDDVGSFGGIKSWINNQRSYIWVKNTDGKISYYFNAPNLQLSISNFIQRLNSGGWSIEPYDYEKNIGSKNPDTFTTAERKYGYAFPSALYLGEMPAVTIDLSRVVADSTSGFNGIKNAVSVAFDLTIGNLIEGFLGFFGVDVDFEQSLVDFNPSYIEGVFYNLSDYTNSSLDYTKAMSEWLVNNWDKLSSHGSIKIDDENIFDEGVIIESGETVGVDVTGEEIYSRLVTSSGTSYKEVIEGLNKVAEEDDAIPEMPSQVVTRHMPYDLNSMSDASKRYMNNVPDQRVELFNFTQPLGIQSVIMKQITNSFVQSTILGFTALICSFSASLNSICDFSFLRDQGFDPTLMWTGPVGRLILSVIVIACILFLVKSGISVIRGRGSGSHLIARSFMTVIMVLLAAGLLVQPEKVSNLLSNTTSSILSITTNLVSDSDDFSELYTADATQADKSSLRYWYTYFNIWSGYTTGYTTDEEASAFDPSQRTNEYTDFTESPATLKGEKKINLWQAALLESLAKGDSRAAYRATDHFLAPVIEQGDSWNEFAVHQNPFYEKSGRLMYTDIPFTSILTALSLLIFTVLKVFCFVELVINMFLFFLKVVFGAIDGRSFIVSSIKEILRSIGKVIAYDFMITMVVYFNNMSKGELAVIMPIVIFVGSIALVFWILKDYNVRSILCPSIIGYGKTLGRRISYGTSGLSSLKNEYHLNDLRRKLELDEKQNMFRKASDAKSRALGSIKDSFKNRGR